jgi:hypothetical protein
LRRLQQVQHDIFVRANGGMMQRVEAALVIVEQVGVLCV